MTLRMRRSPTDRGDTPSFSSRVGLFELHRDRTRHFIRRLRLLLAAGFLCVSTGCGPDVDGDAYEVIQADKRGEILELTPDRWTALVAENTGDDNRSKPLPELFLSVAGVVTKRLVEESSKSASIVVTLTPNEIADVTAKCHLPSDAAVQANSLGVGSSTIIKGKLYYVSTDSVTLSGCFIAPAP